MQVVAEILGPVQIRVNGSGIELGGPRQRRLLAALLVHTGSTVSIDRLLDVVFEGVPPDGGKRTFRSYVARLRRALERAGLPAAEMIVTDGPGYRFDPSAALLDWIEFEDEVRDAEDRMESGDADGAVLSLERALDLWHGEALGEFADEEWARPEAVRLEELRVVARELHAEALVESGRHTTAIPDIERLIAHHPLREGPRRLLMLALYRSGRHAEALRAGRAFREYLREETGLDASDEFAGLSDMVIQRDPRLDARPQGRQLRGYLLAEPIREGPFGITYRASQPSVGRDVEITVVVADQANDPAFVRRFEYAAQQIAAIVHPNVVPLYDYWREPDAAYLVTRRLAGGTLEERLVSGRSFDHDEFTQLVEDLGGALAAAHEGGVVHGHLTASSVLLDEAGIAYLADFGVAASFRSATVDVRAMADLLRRVVSRVESPATPSGSSAIVASTTVEGVLDRVATVGSGAGDGTVAGLMEDLRGALRSAVREQHRAPVPPIEGPNPYRGLYPFSETDADVFFGRTQLVDDLAADLERHPFVAVVGPSGCGKSSAIRAGLLPRIRSAGGYVATMVPGSRPLAELELALSRIAASPVPDLIELLGRDVGALGRTLRAVLPRGANQVVLVVDQFEEAFTMSDASERDIFYEALDRALSDGEGRLRVIVTVRADFVGRALNHSVVGPQLRDHCRLVTPLDAEEIHDVIVGPAEVAGVAVEPALASVLVADTVGHSGSLPLLEYALTELYERRVDGTMTLDAYERLGGLTAVLAQRADELYLAQSPGSRAATQVLFSRLVTPGEGAEDTRRRARRSELANVPAEVIDDYGAARLILFDRDARTREPTVEVAHEALIRGWPRLREWIDDDRDGLRILRRLAAAAEEWETGGRERSELYRGSRLAAAVEWADGRVHQLTPCESEFLKASVELEDDEQKQQARTNRRLRSLFVGAAILLVLAVMAGALAFVQREEAVDSRALAERRTQESEIRRLATESGAALDEDPDLAILLALAAYDRAIDLDGAVPGDVVAAMQTAVQSSRLVGRLDDGFFVAMSPNGSELAVVSNERPNEVAFHDVETLEPVRRLNAGGEVGGVEYSPDGALLAVKYFRTDDGSLPDDTLGLPPGRLFETSSLSAVMDLSGECCVFWLEFDSGGRRLVGDVQVGGVPRAFVWDLEDPSAPPTEFPRHWSAGLLGNAGRVVLEGYDTPGLLRVVDVESGVETTRLDTGGEIAGLATQPQQGLVSVVLGGERAVVWDPESEELIHDYPIDGTVEVPRFSADGRRLFVFGNDDIVDAISLETGESVRLRGHAGGAWLVSSNLSDDLIAVMEIGGGVRVWDLAPEGPPELGNLATDPVPLFGLAALPGRAFTTVEIGPGGDYFARLREPGASVPEAEIAFGSFASGVSPPILSPDGEVAAGQLDTRTVRVVDVASGHERFALPWCGPPLAVDDAARWTVLHAEPCDREDDQAVGDEVGAALPPDQLVDLATGETLATWPNSIFRSNFGPSGTIAQDLLAVNIAFETIELRRVPGLELVGRLDMIGAWGFNPLFSIDGRHLAIGSQLGGGYAIDVERVLAGEEMADAIVLNPRLEEGPTNHTIVGGGYLVTTHSAESVRLWDLDSGEQRLDLPVSSPDFTTVATSPDGTQLYYTDVGDVVTRLPLDFEELADLARTRAQRDFDESECERFSLGAGCGVLDDA